MIPSPDTIAAVATAPGRGGIGVVRVSGPLVAQLATGIVGRLPAPRQATLARFHGEAGVLLDEGIALFFPAPHSYTGEDVLELQGHGGPVVLHEILCRCTSLGARLAQPGEFTLRAFLNGRLDLAQAEGVADLIDASSAEAARGAVRSLSGEFSQRVKSLVDGLTEIRLHVEASIDFPEEDIGPEVASMLAMRLATLRTSLAELQEQARQGAILREGLTVVLAGRPNVGKSSLLNRLAGDEVAIVTPIPGTTRDYVRATVLVENVPVHLMDTAGLRESDDEIERLGIARAWEAIQRAGAVMWVEDATQDGSGEEGSLLEDLPKGLPVAHVVNKIDLVGEAAGRWDRGEMAEIRLSAKTGDGLEALRQWLLEVAGWRPHGEGIFIARGRHLAALVEADGHLSRAAEVISTVELLAEEVRLAQRVLGTITGEFTADDLLGEIFGRFCIGK